MTVLYICSYCGHPTRTCTCPTAYPTTSTSSATWTITIPCRPLEPEPLDPYVPHWPWETVSPPAPPRRPRYRPSTPREPASLLRTRHRGPTRNRTDRAPAVV